jgi:hypothetical protein
MDSIPPDNDDFDPKAMLDFEWLVSDAATLPLQKTQSLFVEDINPLKIARMLRKTMTPQRAALVMEQAQLRIRARRKFPDADRMFFTGRSLEQSSSTLLADYKAKKFAGMRKVADICCGIGGDLLALAGRSGKLNDANEGSNAGLETVGVDRDPIPAHFAAWNAKALKLKNVSTCCESFEAFDLSSFDGVHLDPDRRVKSRTVVGNFFQPTLEAIFESVDPRRQRVAVKIAPASSIPAFDFPIEREWIGDWRECKQQVLWCGPGIESDRTVATVLRKDAEVFQYSGFDPEEAPSPVAADEIGPFLYEPHATVLAANLLSSIAKQHELQILTRGIAYLNSARELPDLSPLLKGYRVDKVLPVDLKILAKEFRAMNVGKLVIKKRGVDQLIANKIARIKLVGDEKATIVLTRHQRIRRAIFVTRLKPEE